MLITQELNKILYMRQTTKWLSLVLDFNSRIEVVKMNVLPRLLYLFLSFQVRIPESQFTAWDKQISWFIWTGARPRIRLKTLRIDKVNGGLALPNLREYYYAAQMRYMVYWCSLEYQAKWKHIELNLDQCQPQVRPGGKEYTVQNGGILI